jgi:tetratricopeptide (TPR) repeat protein
LHQAQLISVLYAVGKEAEARALLSDLSRRAPEYSTGVMMRASLLEQASGHDEAHKLAASVPPYEGLRHGLHIQAALDARRGQLGEAVAHLRELRDQSIAEGKLPLALEIAIATARLRLRARDRAALSEVDDLIRRFPLDSLDALSRPHLRLALLYAEAGTPKHARASLDAYQREVPTPFRGADRWQLHRARAAVFQAEGKFSDALSELREAARYPPIRAGLFDYAGLTINERPELARVYDALGARDSAIAVYERYLGVRALGRLSTDAYELGPALERLAQLYYSRGDWAQAVATCRRLEELWRNADAPLQSRVAAASRSLTR